MTTRDTGAEKDDAKKPKLSNILQGLPLQALYAIAETTRYGAEKYDWFNWMKGIKYSDLVSASMRHFFKWYLVEEIDRESGMRELACVCISLIFILHYELTGRTDLDDRVKLPKEEALNLLRFLGTPEELLEDMK